MKSRKFALALVSILVILAVMVIMAFNKTLTAGEITAIGGVLSVVFGTYSVANVRSKAQYNVQEAIKNGQEDQTGSSGDLGRNNVDVGYTRRSTDAPATPEDSVGYIP